MTIEDIKLVIEAFYKINKQVVQSYGLGEGAVHFSHTEEYYKQILKYYTYLKEQLPKIEKQNE